MIDLPLPDAPTDPVQLADWLELLAVISPDRDASAADYERPLHAAGILGVDDADDLARIRADVFSELARRASAAAEAYPFEIVDSAVTVRRGRSALRPYLFCLALSYLGQRKAASACARPPDRVFEELSVLAAKRFMGGSGVRFGWPRKEIPTQFKSAIDHICKEMGEGGGSSKTDARDVKDGGLDVVAWSGFPDGRAGKLVLFGQCATGRDWQAKAGDLDIRRFTSLWLREPPVSQVLRALFVPCRVPDSDWEADARRADVLFDRCRIAYWATPQRKDWPEECTDCCRSMMRALCT